MPQVGDTDAARQAEGRWANGGEIKVVGQAEVSRSEIQMMHDRLKVVGQVEVSRSRSWDR